MDSGANHTAQFNVVVTGAGIMHVPGSLCTHEPQKASDVFSMFQSLTGDAVVPPELLWKDVPKDRTGDVEYLTGEAAVRGAVVVNPSRTASAR